MGTILAFVFVIGILVFFHELGHFLLAKRSGVRVEKFSLGFGPRLLSFTRGETEYMVCALPLGGYVKMYGEGTERNVIVENAGAGESGLRPGDRITGIEGIDLKEHGSWKEILGRLEGEREFRVERDGGILGVSLDRSSLGGVEAYCDGEYRRGFSSKSLLDRFLIVAAGPAMNFVIPFFFMPLAFMFGISVSGHLESPPDVTYVEKDSPARASGFAVGDRILRVNGKKVGTWRDVEMIVHSNPDSLLEFEVQSGAEKKTLALRGKVSPEGRVETGFARPVAPVVAEVSAGRPAHRAGIRPGDRIKTIDGVNILSWHQLSDAIAESGGRPLDFTVSRDGKDVSVSVAAEMDGTLGRYLVGIAPRTETVTRKYGFFESIVRGVGEAARMTVEITVLFFGFLFKLVTGNITLATAGKTVAGPLLIAKVSGSAAQSGISNLLQFTSLISVNLALINLLPIPMLDGGHLLYMGIEKIRRRPLGTRTLEITQRAGFSFLIFIMAVALYNDVLRMREDIFSQFDRLFDLFR